MKHTVHYYHDDHHNVGLGVDVRFAWIAGDDEAPGFVGRQEFSVTAVRLTGPKDPCGSWLNVENGTLQPMLATALSRMFTALVEADEHLRAKVDAACEALAREADEAARAAAAALDAQATLTIDDPAHVAGLNGATAR